MRELEPIPNDATQQADKVEYLLDARPLCQGEPFILTDAAHPRQILKHGSHFLVLDQSAYIPMCNTLGYGYYRFDTRHLSQWELYLNDAAMSLLSSDVEQGYAGSFLYTNPQVDALPQQKITARRSVVLDDVLQERLSLENYGPDLDIELKIKFYSDFADMFEVRGLNLPRRGERMLPVAGADGRKIFLAYRGLDGMLLETIIEISGMKPYSITDGTAVFRLRLPRREPQSIDFTICTRWDHRAVKEPSYNGTVNGATKISLAQKSADAKYHDWISKGAVVESNDEFLNMAINRGFRDLYILRQPTPLGWGLGAGVPWYCAVFGRDSLITAWQMLSVYPEIAREVLEVLAAYQGTREDEYKEESAGKIMHEIRFGELSRTGTIPHCPYYGTVDATPLWLVLLGDYIKWTGDLDFAQNLWPAAKAALDWMDRACLEGGGYLCYQRLTDKGLDNQGWKDSGDSIMHADGRLASPPIAVCEAQGYLYAARLRTAELAETLGNISLAERLRQEAHDLKINFEKDFWMENEHFVALALDGERRRTEVISSNPGHLLWTGILDNEKANAVASRLMSHEMHSGWGIRTLSSNMVSFNPLSYHNGTVWPHDNAVIGMGMRAIGRLEYLKRLLNDLIEVSKNSPDFRLPEVFCGFERLESEKPIDYPVSCSPQAWAAGSVFQLLQACINLQADARNQILRIIDPALPDWLNLLIVRNMRVGKATLDLAVHNQNGSTYCQVLRKSGPIRVIIECH